MLAICVWFQGVVCNEHSADFRTWVKVKADSLRPRRSISNENIPHRDFDMESLVLAKMVMRELARELPYNERNVAFGDDQDDITKEVAQKRKAFWQPMGGPLPVETRLASFGSKIVPDDSRNGPNGFKAMRYGRR